MTKDNPLSIGERVTGKSLNGKEVSGVLANIPRADPTIGHVQTGEPHALPVPCKLADLQRQKAEKEKPAPSA